MLQIARHFAVAVLLLALPLEALATLGGDTNTVQADSLQMKATWRMVGGARYTVHEIALPTGTLVHEYVSPQGYVFAVAWKGPFKPDLRQLMGGYFDLYLRAVPQFHGGHGATTVSQPDLVVHSMGHMRAFSGRAYLPPMLPTGVAASELQ